MKKKTLSLVLVALLVGSTWFHPAYAVVPPPDGGYPGLNTAEGQKALISLTAGAANTAIGAFSLFSVTAGSFNTAIGAGTLLFNTADQNTAVGAATLLNNTTGGTIVGTPGSPAEVGPNTAVGTLALGRNTTSGANTAVGYQALGSMTSGNSGLNNGGFNTAVGYKALSSADTSGSNFDGTGNSALGYQALAYTNTGEGNVAIGHTALFLNTSGGFNTALGTAALFGCTGNHNTALGNGAGVSATSGDNNIYIGAAVFGSAGESNHTYIGNIKDTSVSGGGADTVTVNLTTGLLGHASSSRRYKEEIKPMNKDSEMIYQLEPVTYRYKKEIDRGQSPAFGLIAEQVAEINPALIARNGKGQPESIHYEMVNAMLLNEFLKEHSKVRKLEANLAQQQKRIDALTAVVQKVSRQLELSKAAPQMVQTDN
jgi:hypothetical protein